MAKDNEKQKWGQNGRNEGKTFYMSQHFLTLRLTAASKRALIEDTYNQNEKNPPLLYPTFHTTPCHSSSKSLRPRW